MFAVTISLGSTAWRLLFKTEEAARAAFDQLKPMLMPVPNVTIADDFGQTCCANVKEIHGLMFEDLDKAKLANVELYLHQQRVQSMCTKAAQSDPGLRASGLMNSPSMYTPGGLS